MKGETNLSSHQVIKSVLLAERITSEAEHRKEWLGFIGTMHRTRVHTFCEWKPNTKVKRRRLQQDIFLHRYCNKSVWTRIMLFNGNMPLGIKTVFSPKRCHIKHITLRMLPPFAGFMVMSLQPYEKLLRRNW